jgi:cell division protein FtsN
MTDPVQARRRGFLLGLVVGGLLGLLVALVLAIIINKAPVPFMDKVPQRTAEQDAAEAAKNKGWDPNAALYGKGGAAPASGAAVPEETPVALGASGVAQPPSAVMMKPAGTSAAAGTDPFQYYVQVGAYSRSDDAEQQRAKLAMSGLTARVTEREQAGRTVYRVRVGPFESRDEAEASREQATAVGYRDATLVPVPR